MKISIKSIWLRILGWKPWSADLGNGKIAVGMMKKKNLKPIPSGTAFTIKYEYLEEK